MRLWAYPPSTPLLHDVFCSFEQLIKCNDFRRDNIFTVKLKANDFVVVSLKLSKITKDEKTFWLYRIDALARIISLAVFLINS